MDEPVSIQPSPESSKVGRLDLPAAVFGGELFGSPVDSLEAEIKDDQSLFAAGPARPSRPAQIRRVTWKDDDEEGEATGTTDERKNRPKTETADEEPASFYDQRPQAESPATVASIEVPTVGSLRLGHRA